MVRPEERRHSNAHARRTPHLVPVVRGQEQAVARQDLHSLYSSLNEEREFLEIRRHELDGAVVVRKAILASIDELTIILTHNSEVLIACIHTHHVLHGISVGLRQSTVTMPVSNHIDVHQLIHELWELDIVLENAGWILK